MKILIDLENMHLKNLVKDHDIYKNEDNFMPLYLNYKDMSSSEEFRIVNDEPGNRSITTREVGLYYRHVNKKSTTCIMHLIERRFTVYYTDDYKYNPDKKPDVKYYDLDLLGIYPPHTEVDNTTLMNMEYDKEFSELIQSYFEKSFGVRFTSSKEVRDSIATFRERGCYTLNTPYYLQIVNRYYKESGDIPQDFLNAVVNDEKMNKLFENYYSVTSKVFSHFSYNNKEVREKYNIRTFSYIDGYYRAQVPVDAPKVSQVVMKTILEGYIPLLIAESKTLDNMFDKKFNRFKKLSTGRDSVLIDPMISFKLKILTLIRLTYLNLQATNKATQQLIDIGAPLHTTTINHMFAHTTVQGYEEINDAQFKITYIPVVMYDTLLQVYADKQHYGQAYTNLEQLVHKLIKIQ